MDTASIAARKRLNVGCGRNVKPGWVNLDSVQLPGVDVVADLERCRGKPLPFDDNSVDEFLLSHVIEHIRDPLPLMEELHRIAKQNALAVIRVPYGSSDDAFEDPTHVHCYFLNSFGYFSQPFYWRADYGYRGDWLTRKITLVVDRKEYEGVEAQQIFTRINTLRNVVRETIAELVAVKPIREPKQELQVSPKIEILLA
jgi:SAM-dependent methyltransferase